MPPQTYQTTTCWLGPVSRRLPDCPATTMPIGRTETGLPIAVQIIAGYLEDKTTIAFARLAEREFGGFTQPLTDLAHGFGKASACAAPREAANAASTSRSIPFIASIFFAPSPGRPAPVSIILSRALCIARRSGGCPCRASS